MTKKLTPYLFLLPVIAVLVSLTFYPTIFSIRLSMTSYELGKPLSLVEFIGIGNFKSILTSFAFWKAIEVTFIYTGTCVFIEMLLGTGIALLLEKNFKGEKVVRSAIFIPMMMTPVAVSLVWKSMYNYTYGVINYYLGFIGLTPRWLGDPLPCLLATILVDVWQWTPFVVIIVLAGLYSLPIEPFEAAEIDGASGWQKLRCITIPLLKPLMMVALLIRIFDSFKIFDNIYILTMGGPGLATEVLSLSIYKANFYYRQVGKAAAMSLFMLVIAIVISQFLIKALKKEEIA